MRKTKRKYGEMPLTALRKCREKLQLEIDAIDTVIAKIESLPVQRDIDIGADFSGNNELIADIIHKSTTQKTNVWFQIQTIFCSKNKCKSCPHGPFNYKYRRNKQGEIKVKYVGQPVFDTRPLVNQLQRIRENPPPKQGFIVRQDNKKNRG
ncbi:MAG: hypothetical protein ACYSSO_05995 [Planctomycetota bacterium]|jgi:hypothetical protein